ncbi:MAG TPA: zf-HC2 domain-containing protein [Acidobacteriota bacterium]|nr:zf-HC2 domain-containing protein [Acidobacteriota bacterium]
MNCQEALALLYEIIDKEASEIDVRRVQEHLRECHHCTDIYRLEESVQSLINERLKSDYSLSRLTVLKSKVLSQLDGIDRERAVPARHQPPFMRLSWALATAASLVLVIAAYMFFSGARRHEAMLIPLEKAHRSIFSNPSTDVDSVAVTQSVMRVYTDVSYSVDRVVNDFHLTGGHTEDLMGSEVAHLVYHNGTCCVSVFVATADSFEIPEELKANPRTIGAITFYDHNCRGCRLVYHQVGNAVIITATTSRDVELLEFVPGSAVI